MRKKKGSTPLDNHLTVASSSMVSAIPQSSQSTPTAANPVIPTSTPLTWDSAHPSAGRISAALVMTICELE